jgi:hypothetical protein
MKAAFSFALALLFLTGISFAQDKQKVKLKDAINNGWVKASVKGNGGKKGPSFLGPCLDITITNLTDRQLLIEVEPGRRFAPFNKNTQTLIVTEPLMVSLDGKAVKMENVYAMCGQAHDGAPDVGEEFAVGKMSNEYIVGLATLIGEKDYHNLAGQAAMWALTDDSPIDNIKGYDPVIDELLRNHVTESALRMKQGLMALTEPQDTFIPEYMRPFKRSTLTQVQEDFIPEFMRPGKPREEVKEVTPEYMLPGRPKTYEAPTPTLESPGASSIVYTLSGAFTVTLRSSEQVRIVVLNEAGEEINQLSVYENPVAGTHKYSFRSQDARYKGNVTVRLIQNGQQLSEVKYVLR